MAREGGRKKKECAPSGLLRARGLQGSWPINRKKKKKKKSAEDGKSPSSGPKGRGEHEGKRNKVSPPQPRRGKECTLRPATTDTDRQEIMLSTHKKRQKRGDQGREKDPLQSRHQIPDRWATWTSQTCSLSGFEKKKRNCLSQDDLSRKTRRKMNGWKAPRPYSSGESGSLGAYEKEKASVSRKIWKGEPGSRCSAEAESQVRIRD